MQSKAQLTLRSPKPLRGEDGTTNFERRTSNVELMQMGTHGSGIDLVT
jgi:hypothetical protein